MTNTSGADSCRSSVDDAVMDNLSKKGIFDQTEKLALTRLSSKLGLSNEEIEFSIKKLTGKNFVRKIYIRGKVGFELTPKGESALAAVAREKAEIITKQLQQAIRQERQAKLREGSVRKLKSIEIDWQNIDLPERELMNKVGKDVETFLASTKTIEIEQPLCSCDSKNYDTRFSCYKQRVENLIEENSKLVLAINQYVKIRGYQTSIAADLERFNRAISRLESSAEAVDQASELKDSLFRLKLIQSKLESFDCGNLSRIEEFKSKLGDNLRLLEVLKKPTHEFVTLKREFSTESTKLYQDPEYPIKYSHRSGRSAFVEKCSRCGVERDSKPVAIG
jgi:DNA-binding transcriptional regulator GbsR (MarR family)